MQLVAGINGEIMKIKLSPSQMENKLVASVVNDALTVNGDVLDFGPLNEGAVLPASAIDNPWVAGDVRRENGEICLTLVLPHGPTAPIETRFPAAFDVPMTVVAGPVPLPPYETEPEVMA
jgi:hypothetical protein